VAVLLTGLLGAQDAHAAGSPCDPATPAAARFVGLPPVMIEGRFHTFGIDDNADANSLVTSDYSVTMSESGEVFWSGTVGQYDTDDLQMEADAKDSPLTVSVSFTETDYSQPSAQWDCQRIVSVTLPHRPGAPMPRPKIHAGSDLATFTIPKLSSCTQRYDPSPLRLQVKPKGARHWTTVTAADGCDGWDRTRTGPGFTLHTYSDVTPREMDFESRTGGNSVRFFAVRLTRRFRGHSQRLLRGFLRVRTHHYKRERVYAVKPDGSTNDEYWNYCVNEGKKTWMHNGNAYCISPAYTEHTITLRRRAG
jgi:hypothetical protein